MKLLTEEDIQRALQGTNPSSPGHTEIAPGDESPLTCAAVLVPLLWREEGWHLLFTRRTEQVESHKGQVAFPGGACDGDETQPEETALREAEEELGIRPPHVHVLGRLKELITITHFRVTPVVGVIAWPMVFRVNRNEVERVFTIPLDWLANRRHRWEFSDAERRRSLIVFQPYDGELLWGATARITVDLLNTLGL